MEVRAAAGVRNCDQVQNSLFATTKFFGNGSEFRAGTPEYTIEWEPIANISKYSDSFRECYISEIRDEALTPNFNRPEDIREIHFDCFISPKNFLSLITPLVHVRLLEIHLSTLEFLEFSSTEAGAYLDLPNLECLEISSTNFTYLHAQTSNLIQIIDNAKAILIVPTNFPKLTYLSISAPTYPPKDEDFSKAMLTCIAQHKTLRYFNFEAEFTLLNDSNGKRFEEKLYRETLDEVQKAQNMAALQAASATQLASLHYFSLVKSASSELWKKFMESQGSLEYIQFWCEEFYYPFPKNLVQKNNALFHTVALNVDVLSSDNALPTTSTIDLGVFRQCRHLKVIFLKGNSKYSTNLGKTPDVCNGTLLPTTLESVKILNILVHSDDVAFIMKSLPNLRSLYLRQIGEFGGYGVKVSDLSSLLERESLQKIELVAAINQEDLEHKSDRGSEMVAKILFVRQVFSCFKARRNSDGGFECLSEDEDDYDDDDETVSSTDEDEDEDLSDRSQSEEASTPCPPSKSSDNQGNRLSNNNSTESAVATATTTGSHSPAASSVEEINAELVDADEANLDLFVQDFSSSREPTS